MTKDTDVELKACPFCGASPHVFLNFKRPFVEVGCSTKRCAARGPARKSEVSAIKAWNTRTQKEQS